MAPNRLIRGLINAPPDHASAMNLRANFPNMIHHPPAAPVRFAAAPPTTTGPTAWPPYWRPAPRPDQPGPQSCPPPTASACRAADKAGCPAPWHRPEPCWYWHRPAAWFPDTGADG